MKWPFRREPRVSEEWLIDQKRRSFGQGVDQPCIDWDAMKNRFQPPENTAA